MKTTNILLTITALTVGVTAPAVGQDREQRRVLQDRLRALQEEMPTSSYAPMSIWTLSPALP